MGVFSENIGGFINSAFRKKTQGQFSNYLPFMTYNREEGYYVNSDDTIGFIWECTPLVYAGDQTFSNLSGLFSIEVPEGSVLQFMLYADPNIDFFLDAYRKNKVRQNELISKVTRNTVEMFKRGPEGIDSLQGVPARNFRLFVSLKIPHNRDIDARAFQSTRDIVHEILKNVDLNPVPVYPEALTRLLVQLFNTHPEKWSGFDETRPINRQVILPDTKIETSFKEIKISGRHFRCLTPKKLPVEIDSLTSNILTGGIKGFMDDCNQHKCSFVYTVNYIFEDLSSKLYFKRNLMLLQNGAAAPSLRRKQEEYMWATDQMESGTRFIRVMPMLWLISESPTSACMNMARAKRMWEGRGFKTQEDRGILNILFISALPFGLYHTRKSIKFIERDFILNDQSAIKFAPIQADFCRKSAPVDLFIGRKGQLVPLDIFNFSEPSINHNCMVAGDSGCGKSFFVNRLLFNNYAAGCTVRIIHIGRSYRKLCDIFGGKHISFSKDSGIILNPFSNIADINSDQPVIAAIFTQMIYSSAKEYPSEVQMMLLNRAIWYTYSKKGTDGQVDDVYDYLVNFEKIHKDENANPGKLAEEAFHMSQHLKDFMSQGVYGKWFNGRSNIDIDTDEFVVFELEELLFQKDLFRVVVLQFISHITNSVYHFNRSGRPIIVLDELWGFFFSGDSELRMMEEVIEVGFKKVRKVRGSFITIFQSLMDLERFGRAGWVINMNSAYKFLMRSDDYDQAQENTLISYSPLLVDVLKSVSSPIPRYTEIFMQTPNGSGVIRLLVDPISYWMYTWCPEENKQIDQLLNRGKSYAEAFEILANMPN
ncbi:MAG: TraC family protein [Proteobacteria bacterium]|nr:TraC family protein [Pseudomonadota bacterium]